MKTKKLNLIAAFCVLLSPFPLAAATNAPLSSFHSTNQIHSGDIIAISLNPGTTNEHLAYCYASNFFQHRWFLPGASGDTRLFEEPRWLDNFQDDEQVAGVGATWRWFDNSNFCIVTIRHDSAYHPPVHALYFGHSGNVDPAVPAWDAINFSISDDSYVPDPLPANYVPNPRFTWIFGDQAQYQYRLRESSLSLVPTTLPARVPKVSDYINGSGVASFNNDLPLFQHDNHTNEAFGEASWTNSILGQSIYLSTIGMGNFVVTNMHLMTNHTVTVTVNGVAYVRTCATTNSADGSTWRPSTNEIWMARNMATNLATIPSIDAWIDSVSPTNIWIKPLYGVQTLTISAQSGFGVVATNSTPGSTYLSGNLSMAGNTITNAAGPSLFFGATNSPSFPAPAGSLYISGGGGTAGTLYLHTNASINASWYPIKLN